MSTTPEGLHQQLGALVATMPDLTGNIGRDELTWLGRAYVLVSGQLGRSDALSFQLASEGLSGMLQDQNALRIAAMTHRALAVAESKAPAGSQGAFIAAGAAFTALQVVAKIFSEARTEILVVDPYLDATVIFEYVPFAPEGIACRLLGASREALVQTLNTVAGRWATQFGNTRPIGIRVAPQRQLHDRLIIVDANRAYNLSQSLNGFAVHSHASATRFPTDIADQKIAAYEEIWTAATIVI